MSQQKTKNLKKTKKKGVVAFSSIPIYLGKRAVPVKNITVYLREHRPSWSFLNSEAYSMSYERSISKNLFVKLFDKMFDI